MSAPPSPKPVLPADWAAVLARVQEALQQAEAAAAAREQALTAEGPPAGEPPWRHGLDALRQRVDGLDRHADRAAQAVVEVDAVLTQGEETVRTWLKASEAGRRKLADWVGRAVG